MNLKYKLNNNLLKKLNFMNNMLQLLQRMDLIIIINYLVKLYLNGKQYYFGQKTDNLLEKKDKMLLIF